MFLILTFKYPLQEEFPRMFVDSVARPIYILIHQTHLWQIQYEVIHILEIMSGKIKRLDKIVQQGPHNVKTVNSGS